MKNHVDCIAKQLKWMVARNAMNMEKVDWSHFIINGVAVECKWPRYLSCS